MASIIHKVTCLNEHLNLKPQALQFLNTNARMSLCVSYLSCDCFNQSCLIESKIAPAELLPEEAK